MTGAGGTDAFPLTDLQEAYLVGASRLVELGGQWPTYYTELDIVGLDLHRAERAVRLLLAQHEHLRTEILPDGGQRVLPADPEPYRLPVLDLTGLDPAQQQSELDRVRSRLAESGIPPTGWPLFEVRVSRLRTHRVRVHIAMSLLLLDGHGMRQVITEWRQLYHDPSAALPTAAATFQELRLAQLADQSGSRYAEHWRYWQERLDSLPEAPRLPLSGPLAGIGQVRFVRRVCHLDHDQWTRLRANAGQHRLGGTTALLHLFTRTLGAWAAEPRFCLNVLHQSFIASHPEAAAVVGQFGATLPLEVDCGTEFWEGGRRTQAQLWSDLEHAEVSGVRITRELTARRGLAPHAFLPYVFTSMLDPAGTPGPDSSRPRCRTVFSNLRTPQVLVDNQVTDAEGGGVDCVWDVVDEAFPAGLPDQMFEAYRRMVLLLASPEGAGAVPDPIAPAHRDRVARINAVTTPVPSGRLEDALLTWAAREPDGEALRTNQISLSRGELAAASAAVAGWLRGHGIGPGDVVPLVMAKGWQQVAGALGVLRSGAAYCPLDAALPDQRIHALLDAVGARVALTAGPSTMDLPVGAVLPVSHWRTAAPQPAGVDPAPAALSATSLAYVIYTSGSTGTPKGVMIDHRAALNTVLAVNDRIALRPTDRILGISSFSFDLSVWDVFGALAAGATLVLPDATSGPDPFGWAASAARHRVTIWNSVPALAEMLVEVAEAGTGPRPPVRAFLLSGDWIGVGLPARMRALWPGVRILAMGGATEAAIWSNEFDVGEVDPAWSSIPYGRPLPNQTMRVLDSGLELRAPWAEGDIHIGGVGLARGYWRDPQRTAERFGPHPVTGERLYRTGDRGRYRPDGIIEFLGRADRQAKIQGFRVEPGEVEAVLRQHPAVQAAVVCVVAAPGGQRRLVGFAVPAGPATPTAAQLLAFLRQQLPHYLVPAELHCLAELPLTANGKVDVAAALAARPAPTAAAVSTDGVPPADLDTAAVGTDGVGTDGVDTDPVRLERLTRVWMAVTGRGQVGPDDDFFALGGSSLLALRLVNRVRAEFGVDLPFGRVFQAPTIRAMARELAAGAAGTHCAVPLSDRDGPTLVLFHPVGGSISGYASLARAWPGPVVAFQSPALAGDGAPAEADLPALTARYLTELRRRPPADRMVLGGWSMGGVLAFEAARQLAVAGEHPDVLMLDSPRSSGPAPTDPVRGQLDFLRDLAGGRLPGTATERLRANPAAGCAIATDLGLLPAGTGAATYQRLAGAHAHNTGLLAAYRPVPAPVNALLLQAGREPGRSVAAGGWRALCATLTVHELDADHYGVVAADRVDTVVGHTLAWLGTPATRR